MGDASEHSLLSASGAARWTRCYGSVALESTQPNPPSKFAAEGTAAHGLAAFLLSGHPNKEITREFLERRNPAIRLASEFIGETIIADGMEFEVTDDFAEHVQRYVDYVESLGGDLMVETKVNYSNHLGVPHGLAWGTSDAIVIHDGDPIYIVITSDGYLSEHELTKTGFEGSHEFGDQLYHFGRLLATTADLKFGAGVAVYPDNNEQGMLYTGGALNEIELAYEVRPTDIIRIVIHQPRIGEGEPLEWYITVAELRMWLKTEAAMAAQHAVKLHADLWARRENAEPDPDFSNHLTPGDKQCRFCEAKAVCPAIYKIVVESVAGGFVDLDAPEKGSVTKAVAAAMPVVADLDNDALATRMRLTDLVERWVTDVRSAVEVRLLSGQTVPGYKLVQGKKGSRSWADEDKAAKTLKRVLGTKDAMTDPKPISPTQAEKHFKAGKITARQWQSLTEITTQKEGGRHVAPETDPRPAISAGPDPSAFKNLEGDDSDLSHLA